MQSSIESGDKGTTLLAGSLDEYFLRTESSGSVVPIVDALGSTRGLVERIRAAGDQLLV